MATIFNWKFLIMAFAVLISTLGAHDRAFSLCEQAQAARDAKLAVYNAAVSAVNNANAAWMGAVQNAAATGGSSLPNIQAMHNTDAAKANELFAALQLANKARQDAYEALQQAERDLAEAKKWHNYAEKAERKKPGGRERIRNWLKKSHEIDYPVEETNEEKDKRLPPHWKLPPKPPEPQQEALPSGPSTQKLTSIIQTLQVRLNELQTSPPPPDWNPVGESVAGPYKPSIGSQQASSEAAQRDIDVRKQWDEAQRQTQITQLQNKIVTLQQAVQNIGQPPPGFDWNTWLQANSIPPQPTAESPGGNGSSGVGQKNVQDMPATHKNEQSPPGGDAKRDQHGPLAEEK